MFLRRARPDRRLSTHALAAICDLPNTVQTRDGRSLAGHGAARRTGRDRVGVNGFRCLEIGLGNFIWAFGVCRIVARAPFEQMIDARHHRTSAVRCLARGPRPTAGMRNAICRDLASRRSTPEYLLDVRIFSSSRWPIGSASLPRGPQQTFLKLRCRGGCGSPSAEANFHRAQLGKYLAKPHGRC